MSYLIYIFDRRHGLASFGQYTFSRAYDILGQGGFLSNGIYSWTKAEHEIVNTARNWSSNFWRWATLACVSAFHPLLLLQQQWHLKLERFWQRLPSTGCFFILLLFLHLFLMTTSGTLTDAFCLLLQRAGMASESLARQERGYVTGARAKDIISVLRLSLQYESPREIKLWKRPLVRLNQKWHLSPCQRLLS